MDLDSIMSIFAKDMPEIVLRKDIRKHTGGWLAPGTLSNLDAKGEDPPRVRLGKYAGYPRGLLLLWLKSRKR
jgi:hypothetical protein